MKWLQLLARFFYLPKTLLLNIFPCLKAILTSADADIKDKLLIQTFLLSVFGRIEREFLKENFLAMRFTDIWYYSLCHLAFILM